MKSVDLSSTTSRKLQSWPPAFVGIGNQQIKICDVRGAASNRPFVLLRNWLISLWLAGRFLLDWRVPPAHSSQQGNPCGLNYAPVWEGGRRNNLINSPLQGEIENSGRTLSPDAVSLDAALWLMSTSTPHTVKRKLLGYMSRQSPVYLCMWLAGSPPGGEVLLLFAFGSRHLTKKNNKKDFHFITTFFLLSAGQDVQTPAQTHGHGTCCGSDNVWYVQYAEASDESDKSVESVFKDNNECPHVDYVWHLPQQPELLLPLVPRRCANKHFLRFSKLWLAGSLLYVNMKRIEKWN